MRTIVKAAAGVFSLVLTPQTASALAFSVDCETRAVEKDRLGATVSADTQSRIHIEASEKSMTLSGNGAQSRYEALKTDTTVAAYFINAKSLKYKMRGPAGSMDISIDRTTGEIYEVIDTKGRFIIIRGRCEGADAGSKF